MHLPSKLLLCTLVLTHLGIGLIVQPLYAALLIAKVKKFSGVLCFIKASCTIAGSVLIGMSLMTMTTTTLDRYIAYYSHLRYREIVTTKRVCVVLVYWLFAGLVASAWLWNKALFSFIAFGFGCTHSLVTTIAYIKIYRGLRHHDHQIQDEAQVENLQQAGNTLDVARYKRSASSMLWIFCLFVLCYLPYICTDAVRRFMGHTVFIQCINEFTITIAYLNSCLNPILYCLRHPAIRASVLKNTS